MKSLNRPAARLLVLDPAERVLLFLFSFWRGPLSGTSYWATPGGSLMPGESYEQAACRELHEEIGLAIDDPGPQIAQRHVSFRNPVGDLIHADERYYVVRSPNTAVIKVRWSDNEREVMADHRWWSQQMLSVTDERVWPDNLSAMLIGAGVSREASA